MSAVLFLTIISNCGACWHRKVDWPQWWHGSGKLPPGEDAEIKVSFFLRDLLKLWGLCREWENINTALKYHTHTHTHFSLSLQSWIETSLMWTQRQQQFQDYWSGWHTHSIHVWISQTKHSQKGSWNKFTHLSSVRIILAESTRMPFSHDATQQVGLDGIVNQVLNMFANAIKKALQRN